MKNKQNNSLRASALQIIDTLVTAAKYICTVGLLICFAQYTWASPTPVDLNIVAHQDDDILFMNPDILNSVVQGNRQVTVYITAGNIGLSDDTAATPPGDPDYPIARENGTIAGYSKLLDIADNIQTFTGFTQIFSGDSRYPLNCTDTCITCDPWESELSTAGCGFCPPGPVCGTTSTLTIGSRNLTVATIGGTDPTTSRVLLIFLRVDSTASVNNDPTQAPSYIPPPVSLGQLFTPQHNVQIQSRFTQPGYTKDQLITQLVQILQYVQPDNVRTQDPADGHKVDYPKAEKLTDHGCNSPPKNFYDHTDHVWGARFAREALSRYDRLPNVKLPSYTTYKGYNLEWNETAGRLTTKDFCLKKGIFFQYALYDGSASFDHSAPCGGFDCFSYDYVGYQLPIPMPLP
jgi:hypothetical protein